MKLNIHSTSADNTHVHIIYYRKAESLHVLITVEIAVHNGAWITDIYRDSRLL